MLVRRPGSCWEAQLPWVSLPIMLSVSGPSHHFIWQQDAQHLYLLPQPPEVALMLFILVLQQRKQAQGVLVTQ